MDIKILCTGGTFDKVYYDALSDYQIGEPQVEWILKQAGVNFSYEIESILKKDSLDITDEDRAHIVASVKKQTCQHIVITHDVTGVTRVELVTEGCMFFFCKKIIRVEDAQIKDDLSIETQFVPELSDFKSGQTRWTFTSVEQHTLVNYQASMIPDFWLPPFMKYSDGLRNNTIELKTLVRHRYMQLI